MQAKTNLTLSRWSGQVVSLLSFDYDDLSSNLTEAYSSFCKIVIEKNKNTEKGAGIVPLRKINIKPGPTKAGVFARFGFLLFILSLLLHFLWTE